MHFVTLANNHPPFEESDYDYAIQPFVDRERNRIIELSIWIYSVCEWYRPQGRYRVSPDICRSLRNPLPSSRSEQRVIKSQLVLSSLFPRDRTNFKVPEWNPQLNSTAFVPVSVKGDNSELMAWLSRNSIRNLKLNRFETSSQLISNYASVWVYLSIMTPWMTVRFQ